MKIKKAVTGNWWLIGLIAVSLFPLFPLLTPGMFVAHDAQDHVARVANFYRSLSEGNIFPRWAANLNWGYGHPILMFLYPLPSYLASFFRLVGFSFEDATKLVFAAGYTGSAVAMFLWIKKLKGDVAGFVSAILYIFAPYRFVDLYVRGAIGENFFFIFPSLACYFITVLFTSNIRVGMVGTSLAVAGMVLSHNALMLMFMPFIGVYALFFVLKNRSLKKSVTAGVSVLLGIGLSSFFLVPAFFEGKYTLRDIVTQNEVFNRFESFGRLLYSPWSYGGTGEFSVQVGFLQWAVISSAVISLFIVAVRPHYRKKLRKQLSVIDAPFFLIVLVLFFWAAIFFMLPVSEPWYRIITTLQKFQFPWRFLSLAVFPPAVLGGILVECLSPKYKKTIVFLVLAGSVMLSYSQWRPRGFVQRPDAFYSGVYHGTTDTGESAPRWSVRFMLNEPPAFAEIVEGQGSMTLISRSTTKHVYRVEVVSEHARFVENTLYFPGWFAAVDGIALVPDDLGFHDERHRGLINFPIASGTHIVTVEFRNTKLRQAADGVTVVSVILLAVLLVLPKRIYHYAA